jgi:hypothetical protein
VDLGYRLDRRWRPAAVRRARGRGRRAAGQPGNSTLLFVIGIVTLILGLITAAVASRLGRGGNGARMIVSAIQVLHIAGALANVMTSGSSSATGSGVLSIVLALAILALLWNSRANAFFAR